MHRKFLKLPARPVRWGEAVGPPKDHALASCDAADTMNPTGSGEGLDLLKMDIHGLLERGSERATLQRAVGSVAAGNGQLILIEGEAGIGKTVLVDLAAREAA